MLCIDRNLDYVLGRLTWRLHVCTSERKYVFSVRPIFHLDKRDADAIVARPAAWFDIRLSGAGGNVTWREGQGRSTYKISRTQTVSCAVGTKLLDGKEKGRNWVIERTYPSYIPSHFREYEILRYYRPLINVFTLVSRIRWTSHFRLMCRILWRTLKIGTILDCRVSLIYRIYRMQSIVQYLEIYIYTL